MKGTPARLIVAVLEELEEHGAGLGRHAGQRRGRQRAQGYARRFGRSRCSMRGCRRGVFRARVRCFFSPPPLYGVGHRPHSFPCLLGLDPFNQIFLWIKGSLSEMVFPEITRDKRVSWTADSVSWLLSCIITWIFGGSLGGLKRARVLRCRCGLGRPVLYLRSPRRQPRASVYLVL